MNKFTSSESAGSGSWGSKAIWDSQSVEIFCDLCIKEVEQGHRPGTHFLKWVGIIWLKISTRQREKITTKYN